MTWRFLPGFPWIGLGAEEPPSEKRQEPQTLPGFPWVPLDPLIERVRQWFPGLPWVQPDQAQKDDDETAKDQ